MAMIEISIVPLGTGTPSVSHYVVRAIEVLQNEKIKYELTAMGTIIEGDLDQLLSLVTRMHQAVFEAGAQRLVTTVKIDDRRDKPSSVISKTESVKKKLRPG